MRPHPCRWLPRVLAQRLSKPCRVSSAHARRRCYAWLAGVHAHAAWERHVALEALARGLSFLTWMARRHTSDALRKGSTRASTDSTYWIWPSLCSASLTRWHGPALAPCALCLPRFARGHNDAARVPQTPGTVAQLAIIGSSVQASLRFRVLSKMLSLAIPASTAAPRPAPGQQRRSLQRAGAVSSKAASSFVSVARLPRTAAKARIAARTSNVAVSASATELELLQPVKVIAARTVLYTLLPGRSNAHVLRSPLAFMPAFLHWRLDRPIVEPEALTGRSLRLCRDTAESSPEFFTSATRRCTL